MTTLYPDAHGIYYAGREKGKDMLFFGTKTKVTCEALKGCVWLSSYPPERLYVAPLPEKFRNKKVWYREIDLTGKVMFDCEVLFPDNKSEMPGPRRIGDYIVAWGYDKESCSRMLMEFRRVLS